MALKEKIFTVEAKNRDYGKSFKIVEMPSRKAEEWAIRVVCAVMGTGVNVPDSVMNAIGKLGAEKPEDPAARELYDAVMANGMVALAKFGITALAKVPFAESKPLMDELLSCVSFVYDPVKQATIPLDDSHVEEASTWFRLKTEAFKLHVDFLSATAG
ncbi:hypothetical protein KVQ01_11120 [Escherichia coli]|uniref:hypothetical protein n=1 Tax=Escherichia coli TaxID=562 RepID=UPI001F06E143|nr:hypothetical protein [Escherichia coli]MCH0685570.1 hypothetical protein [Escherichia coli]MDZ8667071.1 hypothetical protein [Escherichia coli]WRX87653.1 hypothetical protein SM938_22255 [Escherichia coli]HCO3755865.1 hypothetical protein [Escherichia coli]HCO3884043.1 hypothetical protein [Escherichia coli]